MHKFNVCHPEVFNTHTNVQCCIGQTQQNFTVFVTVFENMVLRRIFGPRRDEVTGDWRRLHNEEINVLYSSPNIVRVIKWRRMRWAGHVARMGEKLGR